MVLFMILYYRLPGVIAGLALGIYSVLALTEFKLIPVTLTLAGIAGFILSIGMAVDANVLIFERMRRRCAAVRRWAQPWTRASTAPGPRSATRISRR